MSLTKNSRKIFIFLVSAFLLTKITSGTLRKWLLISMAFLPSFLGLNFKSLPPMWPALFY